MVGDILPKCKAGLGYCVVLILGTVLFRDAPIVGPFSLSFLEPWLTRVKTRVLSSSGNLEEEKRRGVKGGRGGGVLT